MLQVHAAVERVEVFVGQRVPRNRVDGEVATPRGLLDRHRRVALDAEPLVPATALRLAARQGHVDRAELEDRERLADGLDAPELAEDGRQLILRNPEHFEVQVLRAPPEQPVAHEAADGEGPAPAAADVGGDAPGFFDERVGLRHGAGIQITRWITWSEGSADYADYADGSWEGSVGGRVLQDQSRQPPTERSKPVSASPWNPRNRRNLRIPPSV